MNRLLYNDFVFNNIQLNNANYFMFIYKLIYLTLWAETWDWEVRTGEHRTREQQQSRKEKTTETKRRERMMQRERSKYRIKGTSGRRYSVVWTTGGKTMQIIESTRMTHHYEVTKLIPTPLLCKRIKCVKRTWLFCIN